MTRRARAYAGLAALVAAGGIAAPVLFGSSQGGSIDVFVGSTPTPANNPNVANVWAISGSPGTGCARSSTPAAYNSATDCSLSAACTTAAAGDTVRLQAGSYGTFAGCSQSSPGVTFAPASGATATMTLDFTTGDQWLTLDGINYTGLNDICSQANHITVKNGEVRSYMFVGDGGLRCSTSGWNNAAIQIGPGLNFTLSDYAGVNSPSPWLNGQEHEGRLNVEGVNGASPSKGVTITGNTFGPGGCADGIQSNTGNFTISGNHFDHLTQGSCDPHVDSVQWFAGFSGNYYNVIADGNYFTWNEDGLVDYDSQAVGMTITNNVFDQTPYPVGSITPCAAICIKGSLNETVTHNTLARGSDIQIGTNSQCDISDGATVRNNIFSSPVDTADHATPSCSPSAPTNLTQDHNICISGTCTGTGSSNGTPTWVGGTGPSTYAGFALAGGSLGDNAASDGTDIGVNP